MRLSALNAVIGVGTIRLPQVLQWTRHRISFFLNNAYMETKSGRTLRVRPDFVAYGAGNPTGIRGRSPRGGPK